MREVQFSIASWPLKEPFVISGHSWVDVDLLLVSIRENGVTGRGEACGIYYCGETGESMLAQAASMQAELEQGLDRESLQLRLPAGGARNAIDCALWDLQAKLGGMTIFELTGIAPKDIYTVNTVSIDTPEKMAAKASTLDTTSIKVKLDCNLAMERISAVCAARPDADIVVDVNQGWDFAQLMALAPSFKSLGVRMIEQPLPRGGDAELEGYDSPVMLCADESCIDTSELEQAARRYQMINIKLDKTGGLTEALKLARQGLDHGLKLMVGNMLGTSLAMAPAFVVAQLCDFVDLDGPLFLTRDCEHPMSYDGGLVSGLTSRLWG